MTTFRFSVLSYSEVVMKQKANTCVHLGIGLDTARYAHHVSFLDEKKRTAAKAFHFTETAEGYRKFRQALDRLAKKHPRLHLHVHVDAAGQYAENLLQWLHDLPFDMTISVGQPARNKAYRKVHFDKRKADPAESLACARFAIVERPQATPHNPPEFRQHSFGNYATPWHFAKPLPNRKRDWSTSSTVCWPASFPNWPCMSRACHQTTC